MEIKFNIQLFGATLDDFGGNNGGVNNIDLAVVTRKLYDAQAETGHIKTVFKTIETNYIEGTDAQWNTNAGGEYIDKVVGALNDYITQVNTKLQTAINDFVDGANILAQAENVTLISKIDLDDIEQLSRTWPSQESHFNVPNDYKSFTETNFKQNVDKIIESLGKITKCAENARDNGMNGSFCTAVTSNIATLISSANTVLSEYNTEVATAAVDKDEQVQKIKNNS